MQEYIFVHPEERFLCKPFFGIFRFTLSPKATSNTLISYLLTLSVLTSPFCVGLSFVFWFSAITFATLIFISYKGEFMNMTNDNKLPVEVATMQPQAPPPPNEVFIRVGTTLYKVVDQPTINGGKVRKRIPWNMETLRQDYGKEFIKYVHKYDGFCTVPEHVNHRTVIDGFLNLYEPISHKPMKGDFPNIKKLLFHIFGEQYELGMDYLQLLYLRPVQKLPILLLVSEERNTGKTTFLNFLKALFQDNVTFNTNEDFRSQFNADWAGKLLIVVDEVLLSRREDSERLKNLSTTLSYKVEAKGKDRNEISFFAKFVLCSNNESLPVIIDEGETRYWVRKISSLQSDDTDFLRKLIAEIPAFLFHLQGRTLSTQQKSRMWFAPEQIATDALRRIIRCNRNRLEVELSELFLEIMENTQTDSLQFCLNDALSLLQCNHVKAEKHLVRKTVQDCWKLQPAPNGLTYTTYEYNYNNGCQYSPIKRVGRFYTITRDKLNGK